MALYNLRSADGDWRITKFDNDLSPMQSYLVSTDACECPAGVRPSCRHRQMLPKMLAVQAEDSGMFYDFEHDQFLASELPSTSSDDDSLEREQQARQYELDVEPRSGLPATSSEELCEDEGCPNFGTPHVCNPKPKAHPTGITIRRRL